MRSPRAAISTRTQLPAQSESPAGLTGNRCRCASCGEYFNALTAFERHRYGAYAPITATDTRQCRTPAEMMAWGWSQNPAGFWCRPGPQEQSQPPRKSRAGADGVRGITGNRPAPLPPVGGAP
jgi:hypothetical protein